MIPNFSVQLVGLYMFFILTVNSLLMRTRTESQMSARFNDLTGTVTVRQRFVSRASAPNSFQYVFPRLHHSMALSEYAVHINKNELQVPFVTVIVVNRY